MNLTHKLHDSRSLSEEVAYHPDTPRPVCNPCKLDNDVVSMMLPEEERGGRK